MLSPSRGFCCCLPVRFGALLLCLLAFVGSAILAVVTFLSLSTASSHVTPVEVAGFYLAALSWSSLALFSLLGVLAVSFQHPLFIAVVVRFMVLHAPLNFVTNAFFTGVLFYTDRQLNTIQLSTRCMQPGGMKVPLCETIMALYLLTWLYLFISMPALVAQAYIYTVLKRFLFVLNGDWAAQQDQLFEVQLVAESEKPLGEKPSSSQSPYLLLRTVSTQPIGNGGLRRGKSRLDFTIETPGPGPGAGRSFLPSMILTPPAFASPPWSPFGGAIARTQSPGHFSWKAPGSSRPLPVTSSPAPSRKKSLDMDFADTPSGAPASLLSPSLWQVDPRSQTPSPKFDASCRSPSLRSLNSRDASIGHYEGTAV